MASMLFRLLYRHGDWTAPARLVARPQAGYLFPAPFHLGARRARVGAVRPARRRRDGPALPGGGGRVDGGRGDVLERRRPRPGREAGGGRIPLAFSHRRAPLRATTPEKTATVAPPPVT